MESWKTLDTEGHAAASVEFIAIIKWSIGSNLTDCNDYLEVSIELCPEESPARQRSPTIMNKRVQWRGRGEATPLQRSKEKKKKDKKKKLLFCFLSSSRSLSLSPTSSSYSLRWFMVAIHLQAASITSSLLGDHGSSCALWEGFARPTPNLDFIPLTPSNITAAAALTFNFNRGPSSSSSRKHKPSFRPEPVPSSRL